MRWLLLLSLFLPPSFLLPSFLLPSAARAQEGFVQALIDGYPVCLIGSVRDGAIAALVEPDMTAPEELGPRTWTLATLQGLAGSAAGSAPALGECGCMEQSQVSLSPQPALPGYAVASNLPLAPAAKLQPLPTDSAAYVKAARAWLDAQGMRAPVRLTQVLRTDLEGDGVDEVLLAGNYSIRTVEGADMTVGRYAFLLLRRLEGGEVVTSALEAYLDAAPYTPEQMMEAVISLEVVAVVDVSGDGVAEAVVAVGLHEGIAFTLYQLEGSAMAARAECGCGC